MHRIENLAYTPLPPHPSPPEQTMIMQPIKRGIHLNFVSAKAIEIVALLTGKKRERSDILLKDHD